jgi:hypothetical protein
MKSSHGLWVVAAIVAALLPATARAASSPEVLAYAAAGGISVSSPPGATGTQVVNDGSQPAVSPDGMRLAWIAPAGDGYPHVFVRDIAGGSPTQVTTGPAYDSAPAWSPDGARLALTRLGRDGIEHVALVDPDGHNGRLLDAQGSAPTWSPDGRLLAFRGSSGLSVVDVAGRGEAMLSSERGQPSWSPDGTTIAVVYGDVRLVGVADRHVTVVLPAVQTSPSTSYEDVAFNAVGDRLYARHVEVRDKADEADDIRRYALDGTQDGAFPPINENVGYGGGSARLLSIGGGSRPTPSATSPSPVTQLTATASPSRIRLTWSSPAPTSQFAGFTVRYAMGTTPPATVSDGLPGGDTLGADILVDRLAPSTAYSFSVFPRDWSGAGSPAATVTATTPVQVATTLTLTGPGTITYGQASTLSGQLIREDTGAPVAGATLTLLGHHTQQPDSTLATLTTDSDGRFSTRRLTSEATRYTVRYAGSGPLQPATASALVLVRQRITITFAPSSRVSAHTPATVTAVIAPAFAGGRVRVEQHVYAAGPNVLTRFDARSRVTVRLDTGRRQASAYQNVVVTPGARTGYLTTPTYATFLVT